MNSAETADALTHAIRPDGAARMNSISRDLDHAIGPDDDGMRGIRMPQPRLADDRLPGDEMRGRLGVIGSRDACSGMASLPDDIAVVINAEDHPDVADMMTALGLEAAVIRPDFYCFGAVAAGADGGLEDLLSALRMQVLG